MIEYMIALKKYETMTENSDDKPIQRKGKRFAHAIKHLTGANRSYFINFDKPMIPTIISRPFGMSFHNAPWE